MNHQTIPFLNIENPLVGQLKLESPAFFLSTIEADWPGLITIPKGYFSFLNLFLI